HRCDDGDQRRRFFVDRQQNTEILRVKNQISARSGDGHALARGRTPLIDSSPFFDSKAQPLPSLIGNLASGACSVFLFTRPVAVDVVPAVSLASRARSVERCGIWRDGPGLGD